jgi:hypothetical protein
VIKDKTPATTDELRAAFNRAALLHLRGWTFARAMAVPYIAWSLGNSALAARHAHHLPAQPRLI